MTFIGVGLLVGFCFFGVVILWQCFVLVVDGWQGHVRKRFVATIQGMAEKGRSEIDDQPAEHWLHILIQDANTLLVAMNSMVLRYEGREWFFVRGEIGYRSSEGSYDMHEEFFLVAIGHSAVTLLSEQERVFRRITGSTELAAFSILRCRDFTSLLRTERKKRSGGALA